MYGKDGGTGQRGRSSTRGSRGAVSAGSVGRGRRGTRRLFNQGDLRLIALRLISEKPRHGYEVIKAIEEVSMGMYRPSAGAIYPMLTYLEDLGYVTVSADGDSRKIHQITEEGRVFLESSGPVLQAIDARLGGMRKFSGDEQTAKIRQAMDALKNALKTQLSSEPLNEKEICRIADAINDAVVTINTVNVKS